MKRKRPWQVLDGIGRIIRTFASEEAARDYCRRCGETVRRRD